MASARAAIALGWSPSGSKSDTTRWGVPVPGFATGATVVWVLAALYPISTVILARLVLSRRMTRTHGLGFVAATVATELLVIG